MEKKEIATIYQEFNNFEELPSEYRILVDAAKNAAKNAYAPYSDFHVGAAVQLENGLIVTGNNQENAAYPSGLCAERVAVFAAASQNPGVAFKVIAVTGYSSNYEVNTPVSPCGSCRQVIAEYEHLYGKPITVVLTGKSGKVVVFSSSESLLPFSFDGDKLKK